MSDRLSAFIETPIEKLDKDKLELLFQKRLDNITKAEIIPVRKNNGVMEKTAQRISITIEEGKSN